MGDPGDDRRHAVRIHPLPLSLLCGLLLAGRSAGALLTFWFEGVITRADAAQVDPLFQVGTRFSGSYTVETTTPGIPATTDTSFSFHYRDCVTSWIVAVQGLADPWGGTSGQISIGDNAPFAGVTDRYAVTLFPDPASPVVFANDRPFRFFQIDMADYRPSGAYFEPVGDMLHSSALADALPDPALAMRPAAAFQDTAGNKAGGVITFIAIPECQPLLLAGLAALLLGGRRCVPRAKGQVRPPLGRTRRGPPTVACPAGSRGRERIDHAHRAVEAAVLEVLGVQGAEPVELGAGPHLRVEPAQLIAGPALQGQPQLSGGREQDRELVDEFLGLPGRLRRGQQRAARPGAERAGGRRHELDHRLVGDPRLPAGQALPQQRSRTLLLRPVARIEAIDQHVGVDQPGHQPAPRSR